MTGVARGPHRRHHPIAALPGAARGGLVALASCAAALADDGDSAPEAGAPARLSSALVLDPVPIESLSSRAAAPVIAPDHPSGRWGDPVFTLCLAGLAAVVLCLRLTGRRGARTLPSDVCSVLGEMPLGGTHVARVVRFGPKTILVGVTGGTCRTLSEIDDAALTDSLVAACRGAEGGAAARRWTGFPRWRPAAVALRPEATR